MHVAYSRVRNLNNLFIAVKKRKRKNNIVYHFVKLNQIKEIIKPRIRDVSKYFPKQSILFEFHRIVCEIKIEFVIHDKRV